MKLYAPTYYKDFSCIADRCRHSCCIGWEIDVDEESLKKYATSTAAYSQEILDSIDREDTPHFRLTVNDRCPHLDGRGLCRIITHMGEEALCDICREHPRFYHDTFLGREVGLGMACEEACRVILSTDNHTLLPIKEVEAEAESLPSFDAGKERDKIFAILFDGTLPYVQRLTMIANRYHASPQRNTEDAWRACLSALEYLDEAHRPLFASYKGDAKADECILARALAYFVFRHVSPAQNEEEVRAAVGFSLFCERLLASMAEAGGDIFECARILSEEIEYSEENTDVIKCEFIF